MTYELTQEILKELLDYNPDTGVFTWKYRDIKWFLHCEQPEGRHLWWNNKFAGAKAGNVFTKTKNPYNQIMITIGKNRRNWRSTQLAWLYMNGTIPDVPILRKDGNFANDKWENLTLNYKETPKREIDFSDGSLGEKIKITQDIVKELMNYDPDTGRVTWKERSLKYFTHGKIPNLSHAVWNKRYANKNAGNLYISEDGLKYYLTRITLKGISKSYRTHRLIWLLMTGSMPNGDIDHIDHNGLNNKWENLRDATKYQNQQNASKRKDNASGMTGVHYNKNNNKWIASISVYKKRLTKYFNTFDDAAKQRKLWNKEFGFHKNHGKMNHEIIESKNKE